MLTTKPLRSKKKMAEQVRDAVSDYIREHGLKAGDRIPTEAELCAAFGVSRPSVREALRLLEQERLVVTAHGRGRFVTAVAALNVARPITVFESITKMLAALGYAANTRVLSAKTILAASDPLAAVALGLQPGAQIFVLERLREAGGQVLVYSIDVIPQALLGELPGGMELEGSVNEFLASADQKPVMSSANVAAVFLPEGVLSGPAVTEPWLLVSETCLSEIGTPVLYARDYHRGSLISFNFSRQ
ncbi:GntR family transcriptional regulator [Cypionkella psychrotolerans]|uniref:GntR family transcriptional regulator n=1 Tax=Cypionkella psychrotolerans TaxID=1678131 RepID=UPI0006B55065|nr:GntR family transcriptional regulator [Cypionkella psychrotolerans]